MARQDQPNPEQPGKRLLSRKSNRQTRALGDLAVAGLCRALLVLAFSCAALYTCCASAEAQPNRSKWDQVLGRERKQAPKNPVRRQTSPSPDAPKGLQFNHKLNLNALAQLPSVIELDPPTDTDVRTNMSQVRALMVIDDRLLTLPLRYDGAFDAFVAQFPTPRTSLQYQFQLIRKDGGTILSELYSVNPSCEDELQRVLDENRERYTDHRSLVLSATRKLEDIHRMNYLITSVRSIASSPKGTPASEEAK